jgi:hypothetical protein
VDSDFIGHPHGLGLTSDGLIMESTADFAGCDISTVGVNKVILRRKMIKVYQTGFCNVSGSTNRQVRDSVAS